MSQRFFCSEPVTGSRVCLQGDEAHHLAHVMRAAVGQEVTLFDGGGEEFTARIVRIERRAVELAVLERLAVDRELPYALVLGVALPKGDRQSWLIEKAVELGVTRVTPLRAARGVAQPVEQALQRLRRAVIEASKQCGRNRLMAIEPPQTVGEFLAAAPEQAVRVLASPARRRFRCAMSRGRNRPRSTSCPWNRDQGRTTGGLTPTVRLRTSVRLRTCTWPWGRKAASRRKRPPRPTVGTP